MSAQQLAEKLLKSIIKKFKKRKVHSTFLYNIRGADYSAMQLITTINKEIYLLMSAIYNFSELFLSKIKNGLQLPMLF